MRSRKGRVTPEVEQVLRQVQSWAAEHRRVTVLLQEEIERRKEQTPDDEPPGGRPTDPR